MSTRRRHSHSSPHHSIPPHLLSRKRSESLEGLNARNPRPKSLVTVTPASVIPSDSDSWSSDEDSIDDKMDADSPPFKKSTSPSDRPTKPMPSRRLAPNLQATQESDANEKGQGINTGLHASLPNKPIVNMSKSSQQLSNPTLIPQAPQLPRTPAQKDSTRRLIVVLEHACLEAYKISSGSAGRLGGQGGRKDGGKDAKYALLNCDDHQGILAKTGRDIADARPDITHQVRNRLSQSTSLLP